MHQDVGALGNGCIGPRACQGKRMPPKAPAVTHGHLPQPRFLEARLDPARHGARLRWDSTFDQQGQATVTTAPRSPGAAGREVSGFKPRGEVYYSAGGIKRWRDRTKDMQGICGRGGDGPTSPGLLGGSPHLLHSGFFCQAGREGEICLLLRSCQETCACPNSPGAASGPAFAPRLLRTSAPSEGRAQSAGSPRGDGAGFAPGFRQAGGSTLARLPPAPRAPQGDSGAATVSPMGLSHQHLRAMGITGRRGRCPFAPIAPGCGGSQRPAEPRKGMKAKPNCPSPTAGVTAVTRPSHLRTVRPTWQFSLLQLGNSVRPPRSLPGASPFPAADKTLSRSPHALPGRVSAKGPGKDERDFPADLLTPHYLHLLSRTQTDIFPMLRRSAPSLHSRPEQCQECTWE